MTWTEVSKLTTKENSIREKVEKSEKSEELKKREKREKNEAKNRINNCSQIYMQVLTF